MKCQRVTSLFGFCSFKKRVRMTGTKILFLEDDILYAESICEYLDDFGHTVEIVTNGIEFLEKTYHCVYDLYILDLNVPLMNGFDVLKNLKNYENNTPTMVLSSIPNSSLESFQCGCDSFINKNSDLEEIILRLEALIRRQYNICVNSISIGGGFVYDILAKELFLNNQLVDMTPITKKLFECLLQFRTQYLSIDFLEKCAYPASSESKSNVIRYHMHEIRKILGNTFIDSKKNLGYKIKFQNSDNIGLKLTIN